MIIYLLQYFPMDSSWLFEVGESCVQIPIGDTRSMPDLFTKFVCTANPADRGLRGMIFC